MPSLRVSTGTDIGADAERVWQVLADLDSYPQWNPVIRSAAGTLEEGARLELRFEPQGGKARRFRPVLAKVEPPRALAWHGRPEMRGVLASLHWFTVEPRGGGSCRLEHGMDFTGLLAPLLRRRLDASVRVPFEQMNEALRERAEGFARS